MKKTGMMTSLLCAAAVTAAMGFTSLAENTNGQLPDVLFDGTVGKVEEGRFYMNRYLGDGTEEVVVNITDDTKILDAVNGYPVSYDSLEEGESIRVYVGPAMTMSLPPITNGRIIFTDIPADFRLPSYETVTSLTKNQEGTYTVVTAAGNSYRVDDSTILLPYLTRNMVYADNLQPGVNFIVWSQDADQAYQIVIFPGENGYGSGTDDAAAAKPHGWSETSEGWYYYDRGEIKRGWLLDGEDWYYLNPENGLMETGFVTVDGKTYYLNEDGRMLKEARVFAPDENGVLH